MFIGHAAVALAAKPLAPRTSLALLLAAAFWVDMVWPVFLLFGIEQVRIDPGNTAFTPLDFVHYPWTHSLAAVLVWSFLFGVFSLKRGKREAVILGLRGFRLWNSVPETIVVECAMFAAGVTIYARSALFTVWSGWADRHRGAIAQ